MLQHLLTAKTRSTTRFGKFRYNTARPSIHHRLLYCEQLEDRRLLSTLSSFLGDEATTNNGIATDTITLAEESTTLPDAQTEATVRLGAVGDSLSDEYSDQGFGYAENWVELLAEVKGVNFGTTSNWGEPRRDGYEYNWARAGATSETLLTAGQHTALAQQINDGLIDYAIAAIGQNDFAPGSAAYTGIYSGTWTPTQTDAYASSVVANIDQAVQTLTATGGKVLMSNIIDYGVAPLTQSLYTDPDLREQVTTVIQAINDELSAIAEQYDVPLVDLFGLTKDYLGSNHDPVAYVTIGGVQFVNSGAADPSHLFVDDGIHPHTVVQAMCGVNPFLEAVHLYYGEDVSSLAFTEQEAVELVGLTYGGSDTLNIDYADYVILPSDVSVDYGDAPDPTYPTLSANNGARHTIVTGFHLGTGVDAEADGQPNEEATGDNLDTSDDEDGVVLNGPLVQDETTSITVTASQAGLLDAWIDLDQNGTWDSGEKFLASESLTAGDNAIDQAVPAGTVPGITYVRFRFSSAGTADPTGLAADGEVEDYRVAIVTVDLGTVDYLELTSQTPVSEQLAYLFTAERDGILTAELYAAMDGRMTLYNADAAGNPVGPAVATGTQRIDFDEAVGGNRYLLCVSDLTSDLDADLVLANLVQISPDETEVAVYGTNGDDRFVAVAGSPHIMFVNDIPYTSADYPSLELISFHAGDGSDSATLTGSAQRDVATTYPGSGNVRCALLGYKVEWDSVESITINGGGGDDAAHLYGSAGVDKYVGSRTFSTLTSGQFLVRVNDFPVVHAHSEGGEDKAHLYGSGAKDLFIGRPTLSKLSSNQFYTRALEYRYVHAHACGAGDAAHFFDTAGREVFIARPTQSKIYNDTFYARALGFDFCHAHSSGGGDIAHLFDGGQAATFEGQTDKSKLYNAAFYIRALDFRYVQAHVTGDDDAAYLYGSMVADQLTGLGNWAQLTSAADSFYNKAIGFDEVFAHPWPPGHDQNDDGGDTEVIDEAAVDYVLHLIGTWHEP